MQFQVGILRKDVGFVVWVPHGSFSGDFPSLQSQYVSKGRNQRSQAVAAQFQCCRVSAVPVQAVRCPTQSFGTKMSPHPQITLLGGCVLSKQADAGSSCLLEVLIVIKLGAKAPKK